VREEAGELCQTLEADEGKERAASEMADLLYHAMVLLNVQVGFCWWCSAGVSCLVLEL
jgi:phosphoribosyl-ATP pyrophosphohydrolase